jgi:hypothetical protein
VSEAATALGVSVDAVRSRIKRGTIAHEREGGRVFVLLGGGQPRPGRDQPIDRPGESSVLISQLREEIEYLREESRRKDHIIAGLVERIPPAIEAPREARESPETPESPGPRERPFTDEERVQEPPQPRSWWRRVFG